VKTAIVVGSRIRPGLEKEIEAGQSPKRDYFEIARALDATLINYDRPVDVVSWLLWKLVGRPAAHAWLAFRRRAEYDVVHTLSEDVGLVLALLFKLARVRRTHVMVAHYLTPPKKQLLFRVLRIASHIDKLVVYSTPQRDVALKQLGVPEHKLELVLHPADHHFWNVQPAPQGELICSAGLEFRDYPTLLAAVDGLPVKVVIAAASPWSKRRNETTDRALPANVEVVSLDPLALRQLYAQARFTVVPLYDVDFQAGSLVMYEAMACGKAIIATRTRGQEDILRPGVTGVYVPPGDVSALRAAIVELLAAPDQARTMGRNAREIVERELNLEQYVEHVCRIIREEAERLQPAAAPSRGRLPWRRRGRLAG
jgi:glycosyltransferase involved in cell wall biosynthesis